MSIGQLELVQFVYVLYEVIFAVSPFSRYFTVTIEEENEKSSTIFLFWQVILVGITSILAMVVSSLLW